jgi:DNA mismatch endonuclease (patch repair protein)
LDSQIPARAQGYLDKPEGVSFLDKFDRPTRSRVMGRIKSSGTKTTEWKFRSLLVRSGVRGWKIGHHSGLPGSPDFVFFRARLAIFLDGCFWHGCNRCRSIPATNRAFWVAKIQRNKDRDEKATRMLRAMGWKTMRIWEHELKTDGDGVLRKVLISRSRGRVSKPSARRAAAAEVRVVRPTSTAGSGGRTG